MMREWSIKNVFNILEKFYLLSIFIYNKTYDKKSFEEVKNFIKKILIMVIKPVMRGG